MSKPTRIAPEVRYWDIGTDGRKELWEKVKEIADAAVGEAIADAFDHLELWIYEEDGVVAFRASDGRSDDPEKIYPMDKLLWFNPEDTDQEPGDLARAILCAEALESVAQKIRAAWAGVKPPLTG